MAKSVTQASSRNGFLRLLVLALSSLALASPNAPFRLARRANAVISPPPCPSTTPATPIPGCYGVPTSGSPAPVPAPTSSPLCIYYTASVNPLCNGNDVCLCGESGYIHPPLTATVDGKATANCDYSVLTPSNLCPTAAGTSATLIGKLIGTLGTAKTGPITAATPASTAPVPIVNSPIVLPPITSSCTSGDTRTVTFTTAFPRAVGYEVIGGDTNDLYWWNETGAVWVLAVESPGYEIQSLGLYDVGSPYPPQYSSAIHEGPESSQFTISVPSGDCFATQPKISWSVEPTQTVSVMPYSYTLSVSGEYACASHTILNPPQCTHNPDFELTSENWNDAKVDQLLYEWWFNYPEDECNLTALGTPNLRNLSPPNTSNNLASELAYWAANLNGFDCTMAAGTKSCTIDTDPCQYPGIPRWAYLALNAMANLQNNLINVDTALFKGTVSNGFISESVLENFKKQPSATPSFLGQLALLIIGAVLTIVGVFVPVAIPALASAEAAAFAAEEEAANLGEVAVARIGEALSSPLTHAAKSSNVYGIIPGTAISGASGAWSKIASENTDPLAAYGSYQSLLDENWQQSQQTLEAWNDNMFSNSSWAAMLMTAIYGGIYVATPTYSNLDLINVMTTDTTSRMINNIWQQYHIYVQFTNLNDDADKTKCRQDTHGPYASRYCADGGVYYLQSLNIEDTTGYPNVEKPYGYDKLSTLPQPIEPWWITAASSKVYQQYHMSFDYNDANAFTDAISSLIANTDNVASLIGQLPGEWTLPVCSSGTNYYGYDWSSGPDHATDPLTILTTTSGYQTFQLPHQWVPCACGFQGNETVLFYNQTNIAKDFHMSDMTQSCQRTMSLNNNQGFLGVDGGLPSDNKIEMWPGHTLTMTPTSAKPTTSPVRYV